MYWICPDHIDTGIAAWLRSKARKLLLAVDWQIHCIRTQEFDRQIIGDNLGEDNWVENWNGRSRHHMLPESKDVESVVGGITQQLSLVGAAGLLNLNCCVEDTELRL